MLNLVESEGFHMGHHLTNTGVIILLDLSWDQTVQIQVDIKCTGIFLAVADGVDFENFHFQGIDIFNANIDGNRIWTFAITMVKSLLVVLQNLDLLFLLVIGHTHARNGDVFVFISFWGIHTLLQVQVENSLFEVLFVEIFFKNSMVGRLVPSLVAQGLLHVIFINFIFVIAG